MNGIVFLFLQSIFLLFIFFVIDLIHSVCISIIEYHKILFNARNKINFTLIK